MPAIEIVGDLLSADDARGALAVLEAGTIAWLDGCQWIDHDSMGDVIGFASEAIRWRRGASYGLKRCSAPTLSRRKASAGQERCRRGMMLWGADMRC